MPILEHTAEKSGSFGNLMLGKNPARTWVSVSVLLTLGVLAYLFFSFVLLPVRVTGISMVPTFQNGDINFINRLAYMRKEPSRGDVVGIMFSGKHMMYYKRVVGMPGETVAFDNGRIMVDGKPLPEPYLKNPDCNWSSVPRHLGPDEYYVVGDNRSMPFSDHEKGAAERKRIVGRAIFGGDT